MNTIPAQRSIPHAQNPPETVLLDRYPYRDALAAIEAVMQARQAKAA